MILVLKLRGVAPMVCGGEGGVQKECWWSVYSTIVILISTIAIIDRLWFVAQRALGDDRGAVICSIQFI